MRAHMCVYSSLKVFQVYNPSQEHKSICIEWKSLLVRFTPSELFSSFAYSSH